MNAYNFNMVLAMMSYWLQTLSPMILFGFYYGFLTTLPVNLSQIYYVSSLLLQEQSSIIDNRQNRIMSKGDIILSGSFVGQILVFLSIYFIPIYAGLCKPHIMAAMVTPIVLFICIKLIVSDLVDPAIHSFVRLINNPGIEFFLGVILQLMNPALFFSKSIYIRLVNLMLFRYSNSTLFLLSTAAGWLSGQLLFIQVAKIFCLRVNRDLGLQSVPTSRLQLLKRQKHVSITLQMIFVGYFFIMCLGRTPVFLITKWVDTRALRQGPEEEEMEDTSEEEDLDEKLKKMPKAKPKSVPNTTKSVPNTTKKKFVPKKRKELFLNDLLKKKKEDLIKKQKQQGDDLTKEEKAEILSNILVKPWPTIFFDYRRFNRPIRYVPIGDSVLRGPVKSEVAQYFFDTCISDGRRRISFTALPSMSFFAKMIDFGSEKYLSDQDHFDRWIFLKKKRRNYLGKELEDRVKALSNGFPVGNVVEKRVRFPRTKSGECLPEIHDPLLSGPFRGVMNQFESPWMLPPADDLGKKKSKLNNYDSTNEFSRCSFVRAENAKVNIIEKWWLDKIRIFLFEEKETKKILDEVTLEKLSQIYWDIYPKDSLEYVLKTLAPADRDIETEIAFCDKKMYSNYLLNIFLQTTGTKWELLLSVLPKEQPKEQALLFEQLFLMKSEELPDSMLFMDIQDIPEEIDQLIADEDIPEDIVYEISPEEISQKLKYLTDQDIPQDIRNDISYKLELLTDRDIVKGIRYNISKELKLLLDQYIPEDIYQKFKVISDKYNPRFLFLYNQIMKKRESRKSKNFHKPRIKDFYKMFVPIWPSTKVSGVYETSTVEDLLEVRPRNAKNMIIIKPFDKIQREKRQRELEKLKEKGFLQDFLTSSKSLASSTIEHLLASPKIEDFLASSKIEGFLKRFKKEEADEAEEAEEAEERKDNDDEEDLDLEEENLGDDEDLEAKDIYVFSYLPEGDFRRDLVKGALRFQRRKVSLLNILASKPQSSLFVRLKEMPKKAIKSRLERESQKVLERIRDLDEDERFQFFKSKVKLKKKKSIFSIFHSKSKSIFSIFNSFWSRLNRAYLKENERRQKQHGFDWEVFHYVRAAILFPQSYLRKKLYLPILIIAKNIGRMLVFQFPEWELDWENLSNETHIKCNFDGYELSDSDLPDDWLKDYIKEGIQIKILNPFRLRPWYEPNYRLIDTQPELIQSNMSFLTMFGTEIDAPFGNPTKVPSFWKPIVQLIWNSIELKIKFVNKWIKFVIQWIKPWIKQCMKTIAQWIKTIAQCIKTIAQCIKTIAQCIKQGVKPLTSPINSFLEKLKTKKLETKYRTDTGSTENIQMNKKIPVLIRTKPTPNVKFSIEVEVEQDTLDPFIIEPNADLEDTEYPYDWDWETIMIHRIKQMKREYLFHLDIRNRMEADFKKKMDQPSPDIGSRFRKELTRIKIWLFLFRKKSVRFFIKKLPYFRKVFILTMKLRLIDLHLSVINLIESNSLFLIKLKSKLIQLRSKLIELRSKLIQLRSKLIELRSKLIQLRSKLIKNIAAMMQIFINRISKPITNEKQDSKRKITQAYVFHNIWQQIRTMKGFYAKDLLQSRTSSPLIKKDIKEFLDIQGILDSKEPQDLRVKDWKQWLKWCSRYIIVPQKSGNRFGLSQLKSFLGEKRFQSIVERLKKRIKSHRYNLLAYSYLDYLKEDTHGPAVQYIQEPNHQAIANFKRTGKNSDYSTTKKNSDYSTTKKNSDYSTTKKNSDYKCQFWLFPKIIKKRKMGKKLHDLFPPEIIRKYLGKIIEFEEFKIPEDFDIDAYVMELIKKSEEEKQKRKEEKQRLKLELEEKKKALANRKDEIRKKLQAAKTPEEVKKIKEGLKREREKRKKKKIEEKRALLRKQRNEYLAEKKKRQAARRAHRAKENKARRYQNFKNVRHTDFLVRDFCDLYHNKVDREDQDEYRIDLKNKILKQDTERENQGTENSWDHVKFRLDNEDVNKEKKEKKQMKKIIKAERKKRKEERKKQKQKEKQTNKIIKGKRKKRKEMEKLRKERIKRQKTQSFLSFLLNYKIESGNIYKNQTKKIYQNQKETKKENQTKRENQTKKETKKETKRIGKKNNKKETKKGEKKGEKKGKKETKKGEKKGEKKGKKETKKGEKKGEKKGKKETKKGEKKETKKETKRIGKKNNKKKTKKGEKKGEKKETKKIGKKETKKGEKKGTKKIGKKETKKGEKKGEKKETKKIGKKETKKIGKKETKKGEKKGTKKIGKKETNKGRKKETKKETKKGEKKGEKKGKKETKKGEKKGEKKGKKETKKETKKGEKKETKKETKKGGKKETNKGEKTKKDKLQEIEEIKNKEKEKLATEKRKQKAAKKLAHREMVANEFHWHLKYKLHKLELAPWFSKNRNSFRLLDQKKFGTTPLMPTLAPILAKGDIDLNLLELLVYMRSIFGRESREVYFDGRNSPFLNIFADRIKLSTPLVPGYFNDRFLIYKIASCLLKLKKKEIDVTIFDRSVRHGKIKTREYENEKLSSSLIFEHILIPRRRREFRILNRLNLENENNLGENTGLYNSKDIQNDEGLMEKDEHLIIDARQKIRRFLWPRYRLEDLICMNRYWWNTNDGSRSAMLRVRMYPKIDHWDHIKNNLSEIKLSMKKIIQDLLNHTKSFLGSCNPRKLWSFFLQNKNANSCCNSDFPLSERPFGHIRNPNIRKLKNMLNSLFNKLFDFLRFLNLLLVKLDRFVTRSKWGVRPYLTKTRSFLNKARSSGLKAWVYFKRLWCSVKEHWEKFLEEITNYLRRFSFLFLIYLRRFRKLFFIYLRRFMKLLLHYLRRFMKK
nr:hypothetical protein RF1 [Cephalotaxus sp. JW-2022a]